MKAFSLSYVGYDSMEGHKKEKVRLAHSSKGSFCRAFTGDLGLVFIDQLVAM